MGQEHNHSHSANKKTLTISLVIITAYMAVEVVGGFLTNTPFSAEKYEFFKKGFCTYGSIEND